MTRPKLNLILAIIAWALACACVLAYSFVWMPKNQPVPEPEPVPVQEPAQPAVQTIKYVWPEAERVALYPVPLDQDVQTYIVKTCEEHHIDPAIVIAMIDQESDFISDAIGDGGDSVGLMQVQEYFHADRMERLGADDLTNPLQNVAVGIDYLIELLGRYDGNIEKALTAYNWGPTGAHERWFSKGLCSSGYSKSVIKIASSLEGVVVADG